MKRKEPSRKDMLSSCSEIGPEDGADPKSFLRPERPRVKNRKALQLCEQVSQTLGHILAWESGDDCLRELAVVSVVPAPNSGHLLVTVTAPVAVDPTQAMERLQAAHGKLRAEVAGAIHRKKVPLLTFEVVQ